MVFLMLMGCLPLDVIYLVVCFALLHLYLAPVAQHRVMSLFGGIELSFGAPENHKESLPQNSDEASEWSLFGNVWSLSGKDGSGQIHWQLAASISGFGFFCIISLVWEQVRN